MPWSWPVDVNYHEVSPHDEYFWSFTWPDVLVFRANELISLCSLLQRFCGIANSIKLIQEQKRWFSHWHKSLRHLIAVKLVFDRFSFCLGLGLVVVRKARAYCAWKSEQDGLPDTKDCIGLQPSIGSLFLIRDRNGKRRIEMVTTSCIWMHSLRRAAVTWNGNDMKWPCARPTVLSRRQSIISSDIQRQLVFASSGTHDPSWLISLFEHVHASGW